MYSDICIYLMKFSSREIGVLHYNCGKKGHKQRFCWDLKKENEDKGKGKNKEEDSDGGSTNLTYDDELLLVEEHDIVDSASSWVIGSGTSTHVTSRRDVLCSYTSGEFGDVKLTHKIVLMCVGLGDVNLKMSNGTKLTLKDVKHVLDIRLNLLSMARLCDEGYDSLFSRDSWKLSKGSMIVARGTKFSNLYLTHAKIIKDVHVVESVEKVELWHKRLCHMSEKDMVKLCKSNVLFDMSNPHEM